MTTPATYAKANRYLTEHRVVLLVHRPTGAMAHCTGDHGTYFIAGNDNGWTCTCPAVGTCSHIIATEALTYQQNSIS